MSLEGLSGLGVRGGGFRRIGREVVKNATGGPADKPSSMTVRLACLLSLAVVLMAGCAYRGGLEDPVLRSLSWFSYLNGDDLRAGCAAGAPESYRFVYNGLRTEQIRTYEFERNAAGALLSVWILEPADIRLIPLDDPLAPWRGETAKARLSPDETAALLAALEDSGFYGPPPEGMRLRSYEFYWIVMACSGGRFHFNAYRWPSPRFSGIKFTELLLKHDGTGIAFNPPREVFLVDFEPEAKAQQQTYELMVGKDGLANLLTLF